VSSRPVKGKPFEADDLRMRAMEAYIYAQRKGTPLMYGKH
jgi:thiosulfate dehydrogenase